MISVILAFLIACILVWVLKGDLKEQAKKTRNELGRKALLWTVLTIGTLVLVVVLAVNSSMNEPFGQKTENSYYDTTHDDPYEGEYDREYDNEYDCESDMNGVWVNNGCIREPMPDKTQEAKPITLEAEGELIVDKDIPAGRYKVTPIGQGGGFIVRDSVRRLTVNKTLDSSSTGGEGYVFSCYSGDKIKTQEAVKITPVEEEAE
ncbi:hypothetical protein JDS78_19645 [Bacillus cereus group sp. N17]|nr:hypothetical protein [Bacillus cereus group sp. N17]